MKVTGVIAEYNPFHNGHAYQLKTLREQTGADYIVIAMSGEFLQRGVPACTDKYTRTRMALMAGADLVLQLPTLWSCASAEYFATAGIALLANTGTVDTVGYGVESVKPDILRSLSEFLANAPTAYEEELLAFQKEGLSFPAARTAALGALLPGISGEELSDFLSHPNNILAVEYEKALAKWNTNAYRPLAGFALPRQGSGYHDETVFSGSGFASATAIRRRLFSGEDVNNLMPAAAAALLLEQYAKGLCVQEDDISQILYYSLLQHRKDAYADFADCSPSLSRRIAHKLPEFKNFGQFCQLLKTKDLTYTRISRVLLHIMLDIRQSDYDAYRGPDCIPYLKILGFQERAKPLLSALKKEASVPLISKVADASRILSPKAFALFEKDLLAADLYRGIAGIGKGELMGSEYTHSPIVTK